MDDGKGEPTRRRVLPATLGTLAVAAALVAAVLVSLVPAQGFGPLLPVGRVLEEHARHRHHEPPPLQSVVGPAPIQPASGGEIRRRGPAPRQGSRPRSTRPQGPRVLNPHPQSPRPQSPHPQSRRPQSPRSQGPRGPIPAPRAPIARPPAPRPPVKRPHSWHRSRNPLRNGLHHLQCRLLHRHC